MSNQQDVAELVTLFSWYHEKRHAKATALWREVFKVECDLTSVKDTLITCDPEVLEQFSAKLHEKAQPPREIIITFTQES